jgi:hypothetical protein
MVVCGSLVTGFRFRIHGGPVGPSGTCCLGPSGNGLLGRLGFLTFFIFIFILEFTRPKGTEILWEFTVGNLLEPAVMLNTTDEQHTLSQPARRRANTAHGKEGLKHASTRRGFLRFA